MALELEMSSEYRTQNELRRKDEFIADIGA